MRTAALALLASAFLAAPAFAQETIALPPSGTTIVSLNATERTQLTQDTLNASLRMEIDGTSAQDIQDKINKAMAKALEEAKKVSDVKTSTSGYYVYAFDDGQPDPKTGRIVNPVKKWRGSQSIELESKDSTKLLDLAGKIQGMGFVMGGLNYSLSTVKAEQARDAMIAQAIKTLNEKAKVVQTAMGKGNFEIIDMNIDSNMPTAYPMYKTMRMEMAGAPAADMSAPVAQAGESEVSLTITARVLLKP